MIADENRKNTQAAARWPKNTAAGDDCVAGGDSDVVGYSSDAAA